MNKKYYIPDIDGVIEKRVKIKPIFFKCNDISVMINKEAFNTNPQKYLNQIYGDIIHHLESEITIYGTNKMNFTVEENGELIKAKPTNKLLVIMIPLPKNDIKTICMNFVNWLRRTNVPK
jgi:hypothetical protein